jgi:hypothetical protein
MRLNKRAIVMPEILFLLLNIIFFGSLMFYLYETSTGTLIYEEAYSKQIALLIDSSKPPMQIIVNIEELTKLAQENKIPTDKIITIKDNKVIVKLSLNKGTGFEFFTDYDVNSYIDENNLILNINY